DALVAGGGREDGETALPPGCGGRERGGRVRIGGLRGVLITEEEKELVFEAGQHRAADGPAVLVALQGIARGGEEISGVEITVADKFEKVAMIGIGAGLGDRVYRSARMETVLRGKCAGLDFEFLQGIRERHRQRQIAIGILMVGPVEQIGDTAALAARYRNDDRGVVADRG